MITVNTNGLSASPIRPANHMPTVQGRCPACGGATLFLAEGGYVTCAFLRCPNPTLAADVLTSNGQQMIVRYDYHDPAPISVEGGYVQPTSKVAGIRVYLQDRHGKRVVKVPAGPESPGSLMSIEVRDWTDEEAAS